MVADRALKHRIAGLKSIKDGSLGDLARDIEVYLTLYVRQYSQMLWEADADHCEVWFPAAGKVSRLLISLL